MSGFSEKMEILPLDVSFDLCVRNKSPKASCEACVHVCPQKAVSLAGGLEVTDRCDGCGICAQVCPNEVFQSMIFNRNALLTHCSSEHNKKVIVCSALGNGVKREGFRFFEVPCIGSLDEVLILRAALRYGKVSVLIGNCEGCELRTGWQVFSVVEEKVKGYLSLFGLDEGMFVIKRLDHNSLTNFIETEFPVEENLPALKQSRRDFFRMAGEKALYAGTSLLSLYLDTKGGDDEEAMAPKILPRRRELILLMQENIPLSGHKVLKGIFDRISISSTCNGCGECVNLCPTGALDLKVFGNERRIYLNTLSCTACMLCSDICSQGSIRLSKKVEVRELSGQEPELLITLCYNTCLCCFGLFYGSEDSLYCQDCEKKIYASPAKLHLNPSEERGKIGYFEEKAAYKSLPTDPW
ncbi:MAG: hypothetical protein A2073_04535 [Deltaproteobacteria bacterium GWC2_42_11]|nr:MAG: hypothetical protein A2073_04535 [Deltaproteobacteria bacterium GWC2_42_11]